MPALIVIGGGIAGLSTAMLLARDGHSVTVLERDPAPPPPPKEAWSAWERRGINQFRLPHMFMARFCELLESELPEVGVGPRERWCAAVQPHRHVARIDLGRVPTRRRAIRSADRAAPDGRGDARPGRGCRAGRRDPPRHRRAGPRRRAIIGTACACRRRGHRPWLAARRPRDRRRWSAFDAGGVARGRRRAGADGGAGGQRVRVLRPSLPLRRRGDAADVRSCRCSTTSRSASSPFPPTTATGPSVSRRAPRTPSLRRARDAVVWERIVRSYPLVAHWLDGEPVTGIDVIAKIEDRVRRFDPATAPTGLVAIGDAGGVHQPLHRPWCVDRPDARGVPARRPS